jgi:6-phosphogluconate dehydrogenase (decarboxylating)
MTVMIVGLLSAEWSLHRKNLIMQLGMIGLGRMGANKVKRLLKGGHQCVVYDMPPKAVADLGQEKAVIKLS